MTPIWAHWQQDPDTYAAICEFISWRVWGEARDFGKGSALGVFNAERKMIAGLVYHNYDRKAGVVEISGAADTPRWLPRPILWEMFSYPFNELRCQAVVMRVDPENRRLSRILTTLGFEMYPVPRLRGRDKPEVFFVLGDDVWRKNGFHKENR